MNKCLFCGLNKGTRPMFCSRVCIKRAWYCRRHPNAYFNGSEKFWKTETGLGFKWEKFASKLLGAKHLEFNIKGADLDWNGKSVDVKCANLHFRKKIKGEIIKNPTKGYWVFNTNNKTKPDFFFFIKLKDNKALKTYLVPSSEITSKGVSFGWKSKYDKFLFM